MLSQSKETAHVQILAAIKLLRVHCRREWVRIAKHPPEAIELSDVNYVHREKIFLQDNPF